LIFLSIRYVKNKYLTLILGYILLPSLCVFCACYN